VSSDSTARLVVISGPGGVGKGTVVQALLRHDPALALSVSATTRSPRPGEVDGVHYHFLADSDFDRVLAEDGFLEWASFAGNRYGTPWASVQDALAQGRTILLEIEIQGALQVRQRYPDAILIFLAPPSDDTLLERLHRRGTDDPERIHQRMTLARWELAQAALFDHVVVNDHLDAAVGEIGRILGLSPHRDG
jgi:guanylate kinase